MKPRQLEEFLYKCILAKQPILVVSAPGMGKTDIITTVAEKAKADLIISHPATSSPIDFMGLPLPTGKGDADFVPIGDLKKLVTAKRLTVFFMDDIGHAPVAVQAAAMQLFRAGRIGQHVVSKHVVIFAATNAAEHRAGIHQMIEPMKSRFKSIVTLENDVDEWVQWAIPAGVPPVLVAFIMWKRNMLCDFQPKPGLENSPTPRTVENVGDMLKIGIPAGLEYEVIAGTIGEGFATEFVGFLQVQSQLPSIEQALNDPHSIHIANDRPDLIYALVTSAADAVKPLQMENFVKLVNKFDKPIEVLGMLILRGRGTRFQETPAFVDWAVKNNEYLF